MSTDEPSDPVSSVSPAPSHGPSAKVFIPALIVGWGVMLVGARSALNDARDAHPFALLVHIVTFDLAHDLVVAPLAFVVAWIVGKIIPPRFRGPVRAAIATSVLVLAFSYPLVRRWGKRPTNSSTLPLAYGTNVVLLLVMVWVVALIVSVLRKEAVTGKVSVPE
jgi:hypothetical protein